MRAKYNTRTVNKIVKLISTDDYTTTEICEILGIGLSTFFDWKKNYPDFVDKINAADDIRLESFRKSARAGLKSLVDGCEFEEVHTEYVPGRKNADGSPGKPKIKSQKKVKKYFRPDPGSVAFALKNLDADKFSDTFKAELSGKVFNVTVNE